MRCEFSEHEWTATKPMLPNKPRGARRVDDRVCSMASFGSCVQVRHGATCARPWSPHGLLQSLRSVDDGLVALICPTCQMSASARRVPATVHGVVFNILVGSAEAFGRLHHPVAEEATARGLEPSPYFPSGFRIFTSSPCTNSLPQITFPVFSASS
jgi:transposase